MKYPNGIDKFNSKLNKSTTPYAIEEVVSVSDGVYNNYLAHDNIIDSSIRVYTGPKLTGERINNFLITKNDKEDWKREIKIFTNYEVVYITYETYGDQIEAEDINDLQESIANTQIEIERYKKVSDDRAKNNSNKIEGLENSKADKINTYTKSEVYNKGETDARIQNVIGAAPEALDTLQEISASLNNDPEFSSTIINELSKKVNIEPNKQLSTENFSTEEKQKLFGIEDGANKYILPNATASVVGGVKLVTSTTSTSTSTAATPSSVKTVNDALNTHKNDSSIHVTKEYIDSNLNIAKGYSDEKLIEAKTYSNSNLSAANTYSDEKLIEAKTYSDGKLVEAQSYSDAKLAEAKNFSTVNLGTAKAYTDEKVSTIPTATPTNNGVMKSTDKTKLDGIAQGANNYVLPQATTSVLGGVKLVNTIDSTSTTTAATPNLVKLTKDELTTKINEVETALSTHTHEEYVTHEQLPSTLPPSSHTHAISDVTNLQTELDSKLNKAGGTIDGILTLKNTELSSENVTFDGSTAAGMKVSNGNGYVSIAPLNTTGAHIYTDRPRFYLNKTLSLINGTLSSYNGDLELQHKNATKLTLGATLATFANQVQAPSFVQTDGKAIETTDGAQAKATQALNDAKTYVDASNTISIKDTRSINTSPSEYQTGSLARRLNVEFKYLSTMGISSTGTYCTVITDSRWTGSSGGKVNQIALTDDGTIFSRVSLNSTDWSSWRKQLDNRGVSWNDLKGV